MATENTKTGTGGAFSPQEAEQLKAVLIDFGETDHSELQEQMEWRAIRASVGGPRVFTGQLTGLERMSDGEEVALITYKGFHVFIPLPEMAIPNEKDPDFSDRRGLRKKIGRMLGAEVEFTLRGFDEESRTLVGSRRTALERKINRFYLSAEPIITEGRVAEARIISIGHQWAKLEVFGVETYIRFTGLDWEWMTEVEDKYRVGDRVLVRILAISGDSPANLKIVVERRSILSNPDVERLAKCKLQSLYIGHVVQIRQKSIMVRLDMGLNAIAVGCTTDTLPGRGDTVCLVVTGKDEERCLVRGILTRVIREAG